MKICAAKILNQHLSSEMAQIKCRAIFNTAQSGDDLYRMNPDDAIHDAVRHKKCGTIPEGTR